MGRLSLREVKLLQQDHQQISSDSGHLTTKLMAYSFHCIKDCSRSLSSQQLYKFLGVELFCSAWGWEKCRGNLEPSREKAIGWICLGTTVPWVSWGRLTVVRTDSWPHLSWGWSIQILTLALPSSAMSQLLIADSIFVQVQAYSSALAQAFVYHELSLACRNLHKEVTFLCSFLKDVLSPKRKKKLLAYSFWSQDTNLGSPSILLRIGH